MFQRLVVLLYILPLFSYTCMAAEKVNQNVDLGGSRQATWYLPDGNPDALILFQHGFQRNKSNIDHIATELMNNGLMVLTINSSVASGNPSLAKDVADDIVDAMPLPPNDYPLPPRLIIAGHSAGGLFVSHMGKQLMARGYQNLAGAILFDPVDANNGLQAGMQSMIDNNISVLSILANSSSCNSSNNALQPLRNLTDAFVGIKLTDNSKHNDVEGDSTGGIITWLCGTPKDFNVAYLQDFAIHWALDMATGSHTAAYYPGGSKIQELLDANDGILIKEISNPLPPSADFSFSTSELTVQFTDNSSDADGNIVSYAWDFGDGSSSTQKDPQHVYTTAGTYTVTLTVMDDDDQSASNSKTVTVVENTAAPVANFNFVANQLQVAFTDTSTDSDGTITEWLWNFGDGSSSSEANPSHTFAAAGDYSVTLTVTDNDGYSANITQTVSVSGGDDGLPNGANISNLSANRGEALYYRMSVPAGATDLQFAISGGTGDADIYVRFGAEPTTSTYDYRPYLNGNNETVNVASPQAGQWFLMIRAYSNFSGVTLTASYTDPQGNQAPSADFGFTQNGLTVTFTDESFDVDGSINSHSWSFGDGSEATDQTPVHTYAAPGTYSVTLAVTDDDDASDLITKSVTVTEEVTPSLQNGQPVENLSANAGQELHYVLAVPGNSLNARFTIEGGTGDADIYVRYGEAPTTSQFDYRPYLSGNNETVTVSGPQSGSWYVMVRAYSEFSGVTLTGVYEDNE